LYTPPPYKRTGDISVSPVHQQQFFVGPSSFFREFSQCFCLKNTNKLSSVLSCSKIGRPSFYTGGGCTIKNGVCEFIFFYLFIFSFFAISIDIGGLKNSILNSAVNSIYYGNLDLFRTKNIEILNCFYGFSWLEEHNLKKNRRKSCESWVDEYFNPVLKHKNHFSSQKVFNIFVKKLFPKRTPKFPKNYRPSVFLSPVLIYVGECPTGYFCITLPRVRF